MIKIRSIGFALVISMLMLMLYMDSKAHTGDNEHIVYDMDTELMSLIIDEETSDSMLIKLIEINLDTLEIDVKGD